MNRTIRTELLKLRTTRTTLVVAAAGLAFAALLGAANAAIAGDPGAPALGSAAWVEDVVGVSAIPAVMALLLGVLLSAGEHQHGTITTTFLATPARWRVVVGKAAAAALAGPVLAVAMVAVAATAATPALVAEGADVDAIHRGPGLAFAGLLLASSALGALGVALGMLVRSQVAAAVVVAGWALVVEGVVDTIAAGRLRGWLPGVAAADLAGAGGRPLWAAALVLSAWIGAVGTASVAVALRRDVA